MTRDSNSKLIFDTGVILEGIATSPALANPDPTLPVLSAARDAFIEACQNAAHHDQEMTAIARAERAVLVSLFRQLASWVDLKANGDLAVLLSSGFPAQKTHREPVGALPAPLAPALKQGPVSGMIAARTGKVPGAYTYNWRLALASTPETYLQTAQTTGARRSFAGLTPGETYIVQLNAVGTAGASNWSGLSSLMVV